MDNQQADKLKALWKSGRDKYSSFFTVLEEVRHEIGNDALPNWCIDNLRIGMSVIVKIRKLLVDTDAEIVKRNLAAAEAISKAQAQQAREQKAIARAQHKLEHAKKLAEIQLATEQTKEQVERAKGKTKEAREQHKRGSGKRTAAALTSNVSSIELDDLIKRFKKAEALCLHGLEEWIEGSIAKAIILHTARLKFPANNEFGAWCETNEITLSAPDRAALINLGALGEPRLRELFNSADSRSYQLIWRQHNKPDLKLIDGSS